MPDASESLPEWNEENLQTVISELYRDAETDQDLRIKLMTAPFEVLSARINVPEEYRGGIFARQRNQKTLMLYVPAVESARAALPAGTSEEDQTVDYEVICTFPTVW